MATKQSPPKWMVFFDKQIPLNGRLLRVENHHPRNDIHVAVDYNRKFEMNRSRKISGRTFLRHPAEKADLEARPHAALAADGDIAALDVKDGFGQRQPDADAALAGVPAAVKAVEDVR